MPDAVVIEQMKLSDKDSVLEFLRRAYPDNPRQSDAIFWDWHFPASPYCDPANLPIWLAKADGRIAGQLASVPVEFNVAGCAVRAIWILDLIVDPDFRRRGIAKKLASASLEYCPYVLGVNTPKQHAAAMLRGLGWRVFATIPRYQKLLFPGNAVREFSRVRPIAKTLNAAFAPFRRTPNTNGGVTRVERFDGAFDSLWVEARSLWKCSVSRSSAYLDWQYCRQPGKKFEILICRRGDKLSGYAVLFFRKPNQHGLIEKAAISDICYAPDGADETIKLLLAAAVDLTIEKRAGTLVTDAMDKSVERGLKNAGFWNVKSDLQLLANVPSGQEIVYDRENWYLTRGDSDISIFESPNL